jgi:beta-glucosidase
MGAPGLFSQDNAYENPALPISVRVESLVSQMTLEEQLTQTFCFHLFDDMLDEDGSLVLEEEIEAVLPLGVGQLGKPSWAFDRGPRESAQIANRIQELVIQSNRWGIPAIFHEEGLHGLWARGSTVFPQAIGMSCSWE